MEKRESRIGRIPVSIILFVVLLTVLVDGFIWFFVRTPLVTKVDNLQNEVRATRRLLLPTMTPTPTATPSATVTPEQKAFIPLRRVTPTAK